MDGPADRVTEALADAIRSGELADDGSATGMPGAWVLVGVWHDDQGGERTAFLSPDEQPLYVTLGLLDAGQTVHRESMRRWILGEGA